MRETSRCWDLADRPHSARSTSLHALLPCTPLRSPVAPEAASSAARPLTFFHRCWGEGQAAPSKIVPPATAWVQETIVGVGRGVRIVGKLRPRPRTPPGSAAATGHRLFLEKSGRSRYSHAKLLRLCSECEGRKSDHVITARLKSRTGCNKGIQALLLRFDGHVRASQSFWRPAPVYERRRWPRQRTSCVPVWGRQAIFSLRRSANAPGGPACL